MGYLVTWLEGEEVNYLFVQEKLQKLQESIEPEKHTIIAEIENMEVELSAKN